MMTRPGFMYSTFWAALSDKHYYAKGEDYNEIVKYNQMWVKWGQVLSKAIQPNVWPFFLMIVV